MANNFKTYLEELNFKKQLKNLNKKLKNKTVILYGAGSLFQYIRENYDLTKLNVIGISDKKFSEEQEGEIFLGYKIIPFCNITNYNADYVLIATQNYIGIVENFVCNIFNNTKTKVKPLAKIPLLTLIREIWSK